MFGCAESLSTIRYLLCVRLFGNLQNLLVIASPDTVGGVAISRIRTTGLAIYFCLLWRSREIASALPRLAMTVEPVLLNDIYMYCLFGA